MTHDANLIGDRIMPRQIFLFLRVRSWLLFLPLISACGDASKAIEAPSAPDTRPVVTISRGTGRIVQAAEHLAWFSEYVEDRASVRFRIRVIPDPEEYQRRIASGEFDVMHLAPLEYVEAAEHVEPVAVALRSSGSRHYRGVIVAGDPNIRSISDIRGRRVTFVEEGSTSGFLYPLALLLDTGIDPYRDCAAFEPSGSHENVMINLAQGRFDVAFVRYDSQDTGGIGTLMPRSPAAAGRDFHIVAFTEPIPNGMFAISKSFASREPELAAKLRHILLTMGDDPAGRAAFSEVFRGEGDRCAAAIDSDYDPVRRTLKILERHGRRPN